MAVKTQGKGLPQGNSLESSLEEFNEEKMNRTQISLQSGFRQSGLLSYRTPFVILIVSFLIFPTTFNTQPSGLSGGSVVIKRLSVNEGLFCRNVRCVSQDSHGFIWVGTESGVNRYDGEKFTSWRRGNDSLTISHDNVWGGVCTDQNGIV